MVNAALAEDADGGGCGMRSCAGVCGPAPDRWQGNSLDAHAGILQGDRGHFRSNIFRQVGDADPIDRGRRAARCRRRAGRPSTAQSARPGNRVCRRKGLNTGPPSRSSWSQDRTYFPSAHRTRCARAPALFAERNIFAPPDRAAPARKNVRVKGLRFEGALGFVFRPQSENFSRIGRGKKQFSARARRRSR